MTPVPERLPGAGGGGGEAGAGRGQVLADVEVQVAAADHNAGPLVCALDHRGIAVGGGDAGGETAGAGVAMSVWLACTRPSVRSSAPRRLTSPPCIAGKRLPLTPALEARRLLNLLKVETATLAEFGKISLRKKRKLAAWEDDYRAAMPGIRRADDG